MSRILQNSRMRNHDNYYTYFKKQCLSYGMDEEYYERFMSYEILTDMLMTNTDRHGRIDAVWDLFQKKKDMIYEFQSNR